MMDDPIAIRRRAFGITAAAASLKDAAFHHMMLPFYYPMNKLACRGGR
ncbi:MAG: hypothetical protein WB773_07365 [Isosphaeraceae bacterium]